MRKIMAEKQTEIEEILKSVPKDLPPFLSMLMVAGHLHAGGYQVQEARAEGYPGRAVIFAPVILQREDGSGIEGSIDMMFEIRMNVLFTLQEAAEEANVNYRTIQRWRDEYKIPVLKRSDGKEFVPSLPLMEYAQKMGHVKRQKGNR
jgi:hypothetical protein